LEARLRSLTGAVLMYCLTGRCGPGWAGYDLKTLFSF